MKNGQEDWGRTLGNTLSDFEMMSPGRYWTPRRDGAVPSHIPHGFHRYIKCTPDGSDRPSALMAMRLISLSDGTGNPE